MPSQKALILDALRKEGFITIDGRALINPVPRTRSMFYDDFFGQTLKDEWLLFTSVGPPAASGALIDGLDGGVYRLSSGALLGNTARILWNYIRSLRAAKNVVIEVYARIGQVSANQEILLSLLYDGSNRIEFRFVDTLSYRTRSAGAWTTVASGWAIDTVSFHRFRVECSSSRVVFTVDGGNRGEITTNIPVSFLQPYLESSTNENVNKDLEIDYVIVSQDR